jgi:hypothetical protein
MAVAPVASQGTLPHIHTAILRGTCFLELSGPTQHKRPPSVIGLDTERRSFGLSLRAAICFRRSTSNSKRSFTPLSVSICRLGSGKEEIRSNQILPRESEF